MILNSKIYFSLIVLPVTLFLSVYLLKEANGPYYLWLFDQSYAFLANAIHYGVFIGSGKLPLSGLTPQVNGIPADLIGALILRIKFLFSNGQNEFIKDIFLNPESYLLIIFKTFLLLNSIVLFYLGKITYKLTGNFRNSIFIQLSPFISFFIFFSLAIVCLEQILILISILMIILFTYYLYKINIDFPIPLKIIILSGVLCGTGIAVKLNFFPLLFIPLIILKGFKSKVVFIFSLGITFLIFTVPLILSGNQIFNWISNLIINNGNYGTGKPTVINLNTFTKNIYSIFSDELFFTFAYIVSLISLITIFIVKPDFQEQIYLKAKYLLIGIFVALNVQVIIVAKQYAPYYMIPSLMFSIFAIFISLTVLSDISNNFTKLIANNKKLIFTCLIIFALIFSAKKYMNLYEIISWNRQESERILNFVQSNHGNDLIVTSFNASNPESSIAYSSSYEGKPGTYKYILNTLLKNKLYFSPWGNVFNNICNDEQMQKILRGKDKLILQVRGENVLENFVNTINKLNYLKVTGTKELFRNEIDQYVYEVKYVCN